MSEGDIVGIVHSGDATDQQILYALDATQSVPANLPINVSRIEISARTKPEDAFAKSDPDKLSPKQRDIWYCRPYANSIAYQISRGDPRRAGRTGPSRLSRVKAPSSSASAA